MIRKPKCDTCGHPMAFIRALQGWGESHYECRIGCWACAICAGSFIDGDTCADCKAAEKRVGGEQWCQCGAPMVPVGFAPLMLICKSGCAICDQCRGRVAFGEACPVCSPPSPPVIDLLLDF